MLAGYPNKTIKFCVKGLNRCLLFFHFQLLTLTANLNLLCISDEMIFDMFVPTSIYRIFCEFDFTLFIAKYFHWFIWVFLCGIKSIYCLRSFCHQVNRSIKNIIFLSGFYFFLHCLNPAMCLWGVYCFFISLWYWSSG